MYQQFNQLAQQSRKENLRGICCVCSNDRPLLDVPAICECCNKFIYMCELCFEQNSSNYDLITNSHFQNFHQSIDLI